MINLKIATRLREIYEIPSGNYKLDNVVNITDVVFLMEEKHPGIKNDLILENGHIRPDVIFYLDGEPVEPEAVNTELSNVSTIRIVQAMAGG
ncbi:MoaD/ThiS family protein [Marinomonas transparens]|uniref:MoaD/ThiS family protein n=1 Tax=Marinomonas transparens TaxID=2795388 RepID=A0A934N4B4_9GAMM|nr:MoaD/ThiS family protein [Marinomonas transparens]MBJ7539903.1 MoaD/ThiS family protein [Marinomonas transparens]